MESWDPRMNMTLLTRLLSQAMAVFVAAQPALAASTKFTFDYKVTGQSVLQAFDDGNTTYLQPARGKSIQSVYIFQQDGTRLPASINAANPYVTVSGVFSAIEVVSEGKSERIEYVGNARVSVQPQLPAALSYASQQAAQVPATAQYISDGGVAGPITELKPYSLDETPAPKSQTLALESSMERRLAPIPFVAGKTALGPKGRRVVKQIAEASKGNPLKIVVQFDKGSTIEQARERGRAIKSEFLKYGITNISWLNGGERSSKGPILEVAVSISGKPSYSEPKPAIMPASKATFAETLNPSRSAPSAAPITDSVSVMPPTGVQVSRETAIEVELAKVDSDHTLAVKRIRDLFDQGLLSAGEFDNAKARLEQKRVNSRAQLVAEREKLRNERLSAEAEAKARADASLLAAAPTLSTTASSATSTTQPKPKLAINTTPTWIISNSDRSLKALFSKWASVANIRLAWDLPVDFELNAEASIQGDLQLAVNTVLSSLTSAETPVVARLYEGNRVLRITTKDALK